MSNIIYEESIKLCNQLFARFLCDNGLILADDVIIEYTRSLLDSVASDDIFKYNHKKIFCRDMPSAEKLHEDIVKNGIVNYKVNLVSNAFNDRVGDAAKSILPYGVFNIGICTDKLDEYECGRLKLIKFANDLVRCGTRVGDYEKQYGENKLFVLTNRRRLDGK